MQECHYVVSCGVGLAKERIDERTECACYGILVLVVDTAEERVENAPYHQFVLWLHGLGIDALYVLVGLIHVLSVSMLLQVGFHSLHGIGSLCGSPVDGVNLMYGERLEGRVGMLLKILLKCRLRTAYQGVGPFLVRLLQF